MQKYAMVYSDNIEDKIDLIIEELKRKISRFNQLSLARNQAVGAGSGDYETLFRQSSKQ